MKRKTIIFFILFLLLITLFFYFRDNITYIVSEPNISSQISPHLKEYNKALDEIDNNKELEPLEIQEMKEKKQKELIAKLPDKTQRWFNIANSGAKHIIGFYGKVVDQNGQPVSGARVRSTFGGQFLAPSSGPTEVYTDEAGNFLIEGAGVILGINGITHPEIFYKTPKDPKTNEPLSLVKNYEKYDSPDSRKIFTAWRAKVLENVRKSYTSQLLQSDGTIKTVDLTQGPLLNKRSERRRKGGAVAKEGSTNEGQLHLSCVRADMLDSDDTKDWSYTLTAIGGGLQKADSNSYLSLAPESGYSPSITVERIKGSTTYSKRLNNQRYYFTSLYNNQKYFGSLIIDFDSSRRNRYPRTCKMRISFKINLEGGTNLAVDGKRRYR